ncbi:saccharopine dehydrogenase family protein [Halovenus marina]|uniref:saccharopine dehydrogenase family protein n=1 Tax=Halovenus marina TaxID=3396621 RepID=UPI003F56D68F
MTALVYGAYGYTGKRIARELTARDVDIVVAGRNGTKTRGLGFQLGVESCVFDLGEVAERLDGVDILLNCAGPVSRTYEPLVAACLDTGTHYLDITGELPVFEAIAARDREAERAGVCLLPGVGFDVVPTDCLAAHLHDRLSGATDLRLGFEAPAELSGGTLATLIEHADQGGAVRRDGKIVDTRPGDEPRRIDFGAGERSAVRVPWGDVSTAYYTTGIPNVEVYTAAPEYAEYGARVLDALGPVLALGPVKSTLQRLVRWLVSGPPEDARSRVYVWGEATDGDQTVTSRLVTPETYALTVDAAATAVERIIERPRTGFQTPASAFGPDFVRSLDGVEGFFDE